MDGVEQGERSGVAPVDLEAQAQLLAYFVARFERLSVSFAALALADTAGRRAVARALYSTYGDCVRVANREVDDGFFRWVLALMAGRGDRE